MNKLLLLILCGIAFSCSQKETDSPVGLNLSNLDTATRAQDDFFRYTNGGWLDRTDIPGDQGRWGSFNEVRETTLATVHEVLKESSEGDKYPEGSDQYKAATFFAVGMDSLLAEKQGISPLQNDFDQIDKIKDDESLRNYLVAQELEGGAAFFDFDVYPDFKNSSVMRAYLSSGGYGLPERDYYLKDDTTSVKTRSKYEEHIIKMLVLSAIDPGAAKDEASVILSIETKLAEATLTKEDRRNPVLLYNIMALTDISKTSRVVDWKKYFEGLGVNVDSVIVTEPAFLAACDNIVNSFGLDKVKIYLKWRLLDTSAPFLNHAFVAEDFDFYNGYLRGITEMRARWKRVLDVTNDFMGEAIGRLYVDKVFPPEAKQKAIEMVDNMKAAFGDRIKKLDWMSDSTKERALKKLSAVNVKIGYPDKWKDYSKLEIKGIGEDGGSYYANVARASRFTVRREIEKMDKPVDKTEWEMSPQTVNAYYNPLFNEIVFPAAILQPPFYNYKADAAINYGGIGAVIGHEMSHGFDDQGSQFDADGNLKNWWSEDDLMRFKEKGKALAEQFNKYEPLPGVFVQGEYTLGENIGDLGGLNIAYDALKRFYSGKDEPGDLEGFSQEQRFFISWATVWRTKYRDEYLRTQVNTDPHSPAMYRANGPVSNMKQFQDAFGVKEGDKMYREPDSLVVIW